jgi:acyl-CoA thioesterase-1
LFKRFLALIGLALLVSACGETVPTTGTSSRILLMGDSLMATNRGSGLAVGNALERALGEDVIDRSVVGAQYSWALPVSGAAGMSIPKQYVPGPWKIVVMNGGGNDLLFGCGCTKCTATLEALISSDGRSGAIPANVARIRQSGARVIHTGYLRTPGFQSPIENCAPIGVEFERRLARMARLDPGVDFVSLADLVPEGDTSYHQADRIHPSPKGGAAVAQRIAQVLKKR